MKNIITDGIKAVSLDGEEGWTYFNNAPRTTRDVLYSQVSAAFRAYNLFANTIGSVPFSLTELDNKKEYDSSVNWKNKVGFLPNPSELFRLNALSYITTNTVYNVRTTDVLGYKQRGMYHAVTYNFTPYTDTVTGQLLYVERRLGSGLERYQPTDKRLVRMWRLDHTTEVLPSPNTIALAIMQAAGEVYYADLWIKHFYEGGGIAPTLVILKGQISKDKAEETENSFSNWLKQISKYWRAPAKTLNGDAAEVKQLGSSIADLKNNEVYRQAIENIAMGVGMPLSLLLSNSANNATATVEERQWYKNTITPFLTWMDYEYNEQVFHPMRLHLAHNTSTMDAQQEEDAQNVATANSLLDLLTKCPSYEVFESIADSYLPVDDKLKAAARKYYDDKAKAAESIAVQMQSNNPQDKQPQDNKPVDTSTQDAPSVDTPPAKWIPSLDELNELKTWRKAALSAFKGGKPLTFEYMPHYGGLPESITVTIKKRLLSLYESDEWIEGKVGTEEIKAVFDVAQMVAEAPALKPIDDIKYLADALNNLAEKAFGQMKATT